ncbi:MAG: hypothetical protein M0R17_02705 [Candidatus Omnitrophica bacterium]|jgi:hypothetical protein|nr:hypothetical protein [Candidatus Omnitrophota bacterium]
MAYKYKCDCEEFKIGDKQITDIIIYCSCHIAAPKYNSSMWKYCPWCGEKLDLKEE